MSLYNNIFGQSPFCLPILGMLGLKQEDCGRFRDAYPVEGPDDYRVVLYTRLGGNNRVGTYEPFVKRLQAHPLYLRDWDSPYDSTYASFEFRVPEGMIGAVQHLIQTAKENLPEVLIPPGDRMQEVLQRMERGEPTPELDAAKEKMAPLFQELQEKFKQGSRAAGIIDGENGEPDKVI